MDKLILFLQVCRSINFPVSLEKTFWEMTQLTFLGFLIDTQRQLVLIPESKINRGHAMIDSVLRKSSKKLTLRQLQKICGFLNYLGHCIIPGRAFMRQLYSYTLGTLQPHHHIRVSREMRADLATWRVFIEHLSVFCREFADFTEESEPEQVGIFSDAAKSGRLGFSAICGDSWTWGVWGDFIQKL